MRFPPRNLLVLLPLVLVACNGGGDTGVPEGVTDELQALAGAAKRADGDFAKLSEADRRKFVERAGSEAGAEKMVARMAAGPRAPSSK